jgi:hypothetical protein
MTVAEYLADPFYARQEAERAGYVVVKGPQGETRMVVSSNRATERLLDVDDDE